MAGAGSLVTIGAAAVVAGELVDHGVLPGKVELDRITGGCDVAPPRLGSRSAGPIESGAFKSSARNTEVGWSIFWPPGHHTGERLPMVLGFHGDHGSHASPFGGITPDRLLAAEPAGFRVAIAAADGGNGYWHAHGDDDPMAMLIDEFLPMCRDRGLATDLIGVMGTSMGGYGALLFAESQRRRVAAVAAISPAVFSSYDDARAANPEAFSSEHDFAVHDVIAHASRLSGLPVRVAVGDDDPLRPADEQLSRVLPAGSVFEESKGCHTGDFFDSQALPSLSFVAARLASA